VADSFCLFGTVYAWCFQFKERTSHFEDKKNESNWDRLIALLDNSYMALLKVLSYPDPRLHKVAKPVATVDARIKKIVADMAETMYEAPGVGLAATQVDIHERIVVIDVSDDQNELLVFINPEIIWASPEKKMWREGCLSVPEFYDEVERPAQVKVKALDLNGKEFEIEADGLLAVCLQHELDHLQGKVFVEYLSLLKRNRISQKLKKRSKELQGQR
jgi:peptide deformylase